jgi:hypothetical protein
MEKYATRRLDWLDGFTTEPTSILNPWREAGYSSIPIRGKGPRYWFGIPVSTGRSAKAASAVPPSISSTYLVTESFHAVRLGPQL